MKKGQVKLLTWPYAFPLVAEWPKPIGLSILKVAGWRQPGARVGLRLAPGPVRLPLWPGPWASSVATGRTPWASPPSSVVIWSLLRVLLRPQPNDHLGHGHGVPVAAVEL